MAMNSIFNQEGASWLGTDRNDNPTFVMGTAQKTNKNKNTGFRGFLDQNWETYFPNLPRPTLYGRPRKGSDAIDSEDAPLSFGDLQGLFGGIKSHIQSIINGEDVSPSISEIQEQDEPVTEQPSEEEADKMIINTLMEKLKNGETDDPSALFAALEAVEQKLVPEDYDAIIEGRGPDAPPIDWSKSPKIEETLSEDHPARQPVKVEEVPSGEPEPQSSARLCQLQSSAS